MEGGVPVLQLIAYTSLTIASITVAGVSAFFAYRQNFGWSPVILILYRGIERDSDDSNEVVYLEFEFWNRRKYPVAVDGIEITFGKMIIGEIPETASEVSPGEWYVFHNKVCQREHKLLDASSHCSYKAKVPFKTPSDVEWSETLMIEVHYFDPIGNKTRTARTTQRFSTTPEE
jgi:hypothetical protein